jgi:small-conductance mechanosensitive channel
VSALFGDAATAWSAVLVLVLPLVVIGAGELEERLRQRDSQLGTTIGLLRTWVVPLFVVWIVTRTLFGLSPDHLLVEVLASGLVLAIAATALSLLRIVVARLGPSPTRPGRRPIPALVLALPRVGVVLFTVWLLVAGVWNVDLSAALTALGVTSLVVSLALQEPLSSLASGFLLLSDQPFVPGEWIRFDELEGEVVDVNWRTTRIRTRSGDMVVVPNGQLAGAMITNLDRPSSVHRIEFPLQVAYVNPPTRAKEMLLAAARSTPGVLDDPAPTVLVTQVDDPLMGYTVMLWIDDVTQAPRISSDFGSLVWYHSHRHDVPLPSPAHDLYVYDGVAAGESGRVDRAELLRRLRRSPLLDELDDEALDGLADGAHPRQYARGEVIASADRDDDLRLLHRGRAALVLHEHAGADAVEDGHGRAAGPPGDAPVTVLELRPGELFGVLDHAGDDDDTAVVALDDCDVVTVDAAIALPLVSRTPRLSAAMDQLAASRRRRVDHVRRRRAGGTRDGAPGAAAEVAPRGPTAADRTARRPSDTEREHG